MTTFETIDVAQTEIIAILKDAGLIDGESATQTQIENPDSIFFWDTVLKTKSGSDKRIYVVWTLVATDIKTHADDSVRAREAFASYQIFARRPKTSKQVVELIKAIETEAITKGWSFEFNGPAEYERDAAIYHLTFDLFKIFI